MTSKTGGQFLRDTGIPFGEKVESLKYSHVKY